MVDVKDLIERLRDPRFIGQEAMREAAAEALSRLSGERDELKHDIERHVAIAVSLTAERDEAIERAAKVAASYRVPGRFTVSDSWRDELTPSEVYSTAATDVSIWIENEIRALKPGT